MTEPDRPVAARPRVLLKPHKSQPFYGRHPWVLDSAIAKIEGTVADGDAVDLISEKGSWIARGWFNSHSRIRVRLYTWKQDEDLDDAFLRRKIESAISLRRELGLLGGNSATRLIYSEADGLSGLIVDSFGSHLVVQPTAMAMANRLDSIVPQLVELANPASILVRIDEGTAQREGLTAVAEHKWGEPPPEVVFIEEHGVRYGVQMAKGQKTGFYIDQRDNRLAAARYMRGRKLLDMCCYSGGFSLCAVKFGGACEAIGVDTSEHVVQLARANAQLNDVDHVRFEKGDCFEDLDARHAAGEKFDAVVLDPPKFTRGRKGIDDALRAYHRLNQRAVELLTPGGILVTCSCSGNVSREDFFDMLYGVAVKTKRDIQVLEMRGAAADHPVGVVCPENQYLKCFICRVV